MIWHRIRGHIIVIRREIGGISWLCNCGKTWEVRR